jgi:iron complex outermembrane receptor protein
VTSFDVNTLRGYLANAQKVVVQGVETDFSFRPNANWNLYLNGAYTDATYDKFTGAPCPPELSGGGTGTPVAAPGVPGNSPRGCDISGQWLPGISKLSASWGFQYQQATNFLGRDGEFYFGYDGTARSRWSSNPSRSVEVNGRRALDVGGYGLTNFRLGIRSSGSWDVYAWVKNAFDKNYYELLATTPGSTGLVAGQVGDPRTWGVTVRAEF